MLREPTNPSQPNAETSTPSTSFMNQEQFDHAFQFLPPSPSKSKLHSPGTAFKKCISPKNLWKVFWSFFPILNWLPKYQYKQNILGDLVAGLTVGVVHVPQAIAYAILTGVDPVYGLYTAFFGVLFYIIFGTSQYVSVGSFAVISLMTGVSCRNIAEDISKAYIQAEIEYVDEANHKHLSVDFNNLTSAVTKVDVTHEELVQIVTLVSGLIQITMAMLRVEFLASYLSDQVVSGFCSGAAVHVVLMQMNKLVQVNVTKFSGPGYLLRHFYGFIKNISTLNIMALILSACSFVFLYVGKEVIGSRLRDKLPAPLPIELMLVVTTTAVSGYFGLAETTNVTVVKEVPVGLPVATIPRLDVISYTVGPAFEIAFVVVALHLSMCKVFNRKFSSQTDNNQELYALGLVSTLSSFFNSYPISSSLGRSMLSVECGATSLISGVFTATVLLVVILFLGPYLSTLPMCVLAVIIIFSMKGIFQKMPRELYNLWNVARIDFLIWVVTFCATVVLDVMQGLTVAVIFALLTTVFRIQWPRWQMLSQLIGTEEYRDSGRYGRVSEREGIRIFRFDAPLLFTNVDHFSKSIDDAILKKLKTPPVTPQQNLTLAATPKPAEKSPKRSLMSRIFTSNRDENNSKKNTVSAFIIDCSGFTFIDFTSVAALIDVFNRLRARRIIVYFAEAKAPIRDVLETCGFFAHVPKNNFFPTIHDAALAAAAARDEALIVVETPRTEQNYFLDHSYVPSTPGSPHASVIAMERSMNGINTSHRHLAAPSNATIWDPREHVDVNDDV